MPSGSPRSKLANCVSPHEDSGGMGNRSIITTFADARVSGVKLKRQARKPARRDGTCRPGVGRQRGPYPFVDKGKEFLEIFWGHLAKRWGAVSQFPAALCVWLLCREPKYLR